MCLSWNNVYTRIFLFYVTPKISSRVPQVEYTGIEDKMRGNPLKLQVIRLIQHVGFEVLTAVVTKSTIFWDITPCSVVRWKSTNVSEEHIASILKVEE
jgi:hypothetical protein